LLHKMRSIFRNGTVATNSGSPKPTEMLPRSLNQERRRRELANITRENLGIVQRIRMSKPSYSAHSQLKERQRTEEILKRISRSGQRRLDSFSSAASAITSFHNNAFSSSASAAQLSSCATSLSRSRSQHAAPLGSHYGDNNVIGYGHAGVGDGPQYGDELASSSVMAASLTLDELRPSSVRLQRSSLQAVASAPALPVARGNNPVYALPEPRFARDPSMADATTCSVSRSNVTLSQSSASVAFPGNSMTATKGGKQKPASGAVLELRVSSAGRVDVAVAI